MRTVFIVITLLLSSALWAQDPSTREVLGIETRIELLNSEVVQGETVYLKLTVHNRTNPLIVATFQSKLYYSEGNDIEITIQPPGELPSRYEGPYSGIYSLREPNLKPGELVYFYLPILYSKKAESGLVFDKPGEYTLSAKISYTVLRQNEKLSVALPPTKIKVSAPQGKAEEAFKIIGNKAMAEALHKLETSDKEILDKLGRIANEFADTPYTVAAVYALGESLRDAGQQMEAVARFRQVVRNFPNHPLAAGAAYSVARALDELGQFDLAREWLYYLADAFPGYTMLVKENPISNKYLFEQAPAYEQRRWWLFTRPWEMKISATTQPAPQPAQQ